MAHVSKPSDAQRPNSRRPSRRRSGARSTPAQRRAHQAKQRRRAQAEQEQHQALHNGAPHQGEQLDSSAQRFVDYRHAHTSGETAGAARPTGTGRTRGASAPVGVEGQGHSTTTARTKRGKKSGVKAGRKIGSLAAKWELWKPHVKNFGLPLAINHAVTVGILVAISVTVGVGAGFSRVPAMIGSLWMVLNLGSLNMTGAELGFLPLLPAMLFVWGHARRTTRILGTSVSVRGLRVFTVLGLLIPLLLTLLAWLMLWDASRVFDMAAPNLAEVLLSTLLVNGAALVIGMRPRIWRALLLRRDMPTWPVEAFRLATRFLLWMCAAGALVAFIYALTNLSAVVDSFGITNDLGGAIGLSLLAVLYIPNIAIGAAAVLMGGEFHIGHGAITLFTSSNVNLPPVPVMAAIPHDSLPGGPFYLAITGVLALGVVYRYVSQRGFVEAPIAMSVGAGAAVAFLGFCVAWLSGGQLGVYGAAGPLEWLFAAESAAWLLVPALVFMIYASRVGSSVVEDVDVVSSAPASRPVGEEAQSDEDTEVASEEERVASEKKGTKGKTADNKTEDNKEGEEAGEKQAKDADSDGSADPETKVDADPDEGEVNNQTGADGDTADDSDHNEGEDTEDKDEDSDAGLGDGDSTPKRD